MTLSPGNGTIAKITRPKATGVFPRARLFRLLDKHLEYPAVWLSASAGSGKTTLAASYLAKKRFSSIWYQMDPGDSDIATFFYYMSRAVAKAFPRRASLPNLTSEYLQGIGIFTTRYFEKLYSRFKPPFLIVFDDYHLVAEHSPLHQVVNTCMNLLPDGIHILCISRHDPPPQFARLRANGHLRVMASGNIRFTLDESISMVGKKDFGGVPKAAIQSLYKKTGGWAAGLVLMLERARMMDIDSVESPGLAEEDVFDYFACEVFEKTDPQTREFLIKTSFLPKMTVAMARALTGMEKSGNILADLYRNHFFIQKDVQVQPYYQYHPLFRDFLQSRASDLMTSKQILETSRISAGILEKAGQIEDAIGLLISAKDWEHLAPLLFSHAPAFIQQGRRDTMETWLTAFPEAFRERSPWYLYWLGACRMDRTPRKSFVFYEKAFQLFESQTDLTGALISWSGAVSSVILTWDDYTLLDPWVEWLVNFLEKERQFPTREVEALVAANMAAALVWRFPFRHDVEEWLDRADRLSQEIGDEGLAFQNQFQRMLYLFFIGDLNRLDILVQTMSKMVNPQTPSLSRICLTVSQALSKILLSYGDPEALELVADGLDMSEQTGIFLFKNILYTLGYYAALNIGDMAIADEYLHKKARDLKKGTRDHAGRYYMCFAWRRLIDGDFAQARTFSEQGFRIAVEGGGLNGLQMMHHQLALILLAQEKYGDALRHIHSAQKLIPNSDEGYYHDYLCYLTEAAIYLDMSKNIKALKYLKKAMTIGRTQGYKNLFLFWRPSLMARLCAEALMNNIEVDYVRELVVATGLSGEGVPAHITNWPWPVQIVTLGKFELHLDGAPLSFTGKAPKKPLQLLMAIVSMGGKNVRNERLKDRLWPDAEGDKAQSAFTSALSRLRGLIGNETAVQVHDGTVSLDPKYCWIDTWAFEQLVDLAEKGFNSDHNAENAETLAWAEKALNMYGGPFLAGAEDQPWMIPLREHLSRQYRRLARSTEDRPAPENRQHS